MLHFLKSSFTTCTYHFLTSWLRSSIQHARIMILKNVCPILCFLPKAELDKNSCTGKWFKRKEWRTRQGEIGQEEKPDKCCIEVTTEGNGTSILSYSPKRHTICHPKLFIQKSWVHVSCHQTIVNLCSGCPQRSSLPNATELHMCTGPKITKQNKKKTWCWGKKSKGVQYISDEILSLQLSSSVFRTNHLSIDILRDLAKKMARQCPKGLSKNFFPINTVMKMKKHNVSKELRIWKDVSSTIWSCENRH